MIIGSLLVVSLFSSCALLFGGLFLRYDDGTLSGTVNGESWTLATGIIDSSGYFDLYGTTVTDPCNWLSTTPDDYVMGYVPMAVGEYKVGLTQDASITIYAGGVNYIMTKSQAKIEILTITDTEVTGQLVAEGDDDNTISGQFTLTICTD